jgi:hypothetical protein
MDQYQHLWGVVQQVAPRSELPAATLQLELEQYRRRLLQLYHNKVRVPVCVEAGLRAGTAAARAARGKHASSDSRHHANCTRRSQACTRGV